VSELLVAGLSKSKHDLESGISEAERELAVTEAYCHKLEQLIAVGKATLHAAAQATLQPTTSKAEAYVPPSSPETSSATHEETSTHGDTATHAETTSHADTATHGETATDSDTNGGSNLRKRLAAEADKSTLASRSA
jgi:hypothetical protein